MNLRLREIQNIREYCLMKIKCSQLSYLNTGRIQILMYFKGKSIDTTENIDVHFLKSAVVSGTVIVI
jgi:hypothetical protein